MRERRRKRIREKTRKKKKEAKGSQRCPYLKSRGGSAFQKWLSTMRRGKGRGGGSFKRQRANAQTRASGEEAEAVSRAAMGEGDSGDEGLHTTIKQKKKKKKNKTHTHRTPKKNPSKHPLRVELRDADPCKGAASFLTPQVTRFSPTSRHKDYALLPTGADSGVRGGSYSRGGRVVNFSQGVRAVGSPPPIGGSGSLQGVSRSKVEGERGPSNVSWESAYFNLRGS